MRRLDIKLGERSYPVYATSGFEVLGACLREAGISGRIVAVTDSNVDEHQWDDFADALGFFVDKVVIEPGEKNKNIDTLIGIYKCLMSMGLDRGSAIIAFGGGVVGDITGFAAATYLRGINFIQVPTTLLAQVDSSVGGKVGIDFENAKNMIGAFYQPKMVYINVETLRTLPIREIRTGLAEVVKHGVIADASFFEFVEKNLDGIFNFDSSILEPLVLENCRIKGRVVERDERESSLREILNFGHTFGHAIEAVSGFEYSHGESVSIGMMGAFKMACKLGMADEKGAARLETLLKNIGLPVTASGIDRDVVFQQLFYDKKVKNGQITFILPERIGKVKQLVVSDHDLIKETLGEIII